MPSYNTNLYTVYYFVLIYPLIRVKFTNNKYKLQNKHDK